MPQRPRELTTDILVVGAGVGGVAAALAAAALGQRVILSEELDWIGGQLTAQAVPPDEHPWIEERGCTASYRQFRDGVRAYYRSSYPLRSDPRDDPHLNPGQGSVSRLCHEPRVALAVLEAMLAPFRVDGQLRLLLRHRPIAAATDGDRVVAVTLRSEADDAEVTVHAPYVLDATELGDLLPLAGVEHVVGSESQAETGEPHALTGRADPLDQQGVTWCFAVDHQPGENHTIDRPEMYDFWRAFGADFLPGPLLGWVADNPETGIARHYGLSLGEGNHGVEFDLWTYRRIFSRGPYPAGRYASDVTLVNWPMNDYWQRPLIGVPEVDAVRAGWEARQLSLSLLYWLQTDAPRPKGGYGFPGLRLRGDLLDGRDGLAKAIYVRESRRIRAEFTVCEQHVGVEARGALGQAEQFPDSVGIGSYRIDLHPSTAPRGTIDISSYPFQLPLGALIPQRVENLLPACKNAGVTHITNGCYRLHPVEWTIGEAAGALAAWSLTHGTTPRAIRTDERRFRDFQEMLVRRLGFELEWPAAIRGVAR